ncbi:hypothetical protein ASG52_22625 [Methylobacterium sp. Leaf456]|uniref:hypothetical protein n=1 Tax=Methylobacterium sp. Leaf456 TaxID=1736382 RepID=UPI0006FEB842|nr:hypothetical protein [Methylobacterium sp. Leaf456]KQT58245.1 hypothetical protein ASG52_22625 [Methylobacterium sp. Leaf456]
MTGRPKGKGAGRTPKRSAPPPPPDDPAGKPGPRFASISASRPADRRKLNIFVSDPMAGRRARYRTSIDVNNEPGLLPGPVGALVEVIDYDGEHDQYYTPVDLNEPVHLMQGGLLPNESDPRFHQQMVYAVTMKVVESARRALGRPIKFYRSERTPRLRLIPHAFYGANAFFDPKSNAIFFGYFKADSDDPGPNLPGQLVFTCLSHDIIAHEVTHAIVHGLRRYFLEPTNHDVLAFHEAFADIVALFQRFSYAPILREQIQASKGRIQDQAMLVELARQFGYASGSGQALRSALGVKPDPTLLGRTFECHDRGAILVSAVFDGFYRTYEGRIADLLRIATNGSGELPAGHLHPDLVERVANEASVLADHVLRMCLRAFDYLPPVDVTFGDFLRALVTADLDVNPEDRFELRFNMIEGFRIRGIFPDGVFSLAEESLTLPTCDDPGLDLDPHLVELVQLLFAINARALDWAGRVVQRTRPSSDGLAAFQSVVRESDEDPDDADEEGSLLPSERGLKRKIGQGLGHYVSQRAVALGFEPDKPIAVVSFHPVHRIGLDQRVLVEFVVQFVQTDETRSAEFGGIPMRAGLTAIFSADGRLRTVVSRPMPHPGVTEPFAAAAGARADRQRAFVEAIDLGDPRLAWGPDGYEAVRMKLRKSLASLHAGIL